MKTIEIKCKGSMELELDELVPFQGDLKELSKENYNKLRKSILELGFSAPCFVWKHNKTGDWKVIDSHQRIRVLTELRNSEGYTIPKLPCVEIEAINEHEAKKKLLAITSNYGEITSDGLFSFASQANIDLPTLEDFRFPEIDMDKWKAEFFDEPTAEGLTDADEVPEVEKNIHNVKRGQVWKLGEHRLMCGDSTSEQDVSVLMNGEKADMVFTDPPYGMNAVSKSGVLSKNYKTDILGDDNTDAAKDSFKLCQKLFKNIPQFWWGANYYSSMLPDSECWIVWNKNNGLSDQTDAELAWSNCRSVVRMFTMSSEKTNRVHPTQKPVELFEQIVKRMKLDGSRVIDLFGGSGSTLIACEKTGRKCFAMELDEHYCSVIIERWQQFTGRTAELIQDV